MLLRDGGAQTEKQFASWIPARPPGLSKTVTDQESRPQLASSLRTAWSVMASHRDLHDVMALQHKVPPANQPRIRKRTKPPPKPRLYGIARELYEIMGENAPPIVLNAAKTKGMPGAKSTAPPVKLKGKDGKYVRHWQMKPFDNQARKDGLKLSHWAAMPNEPSTSQAKESEPYFFAKFNTESNVFAFDDEEYEKYLKDERWTREETDHLFTLCRKFDLRFVLVADRWDEPVGEWTPKPKTIEELKERYYSCCRRLIRTRPTADEAARDQLHATYSFDIRSFAVLKPTLTTTDRETARKEYLKSLINRTPAQIAEEEFLYVESRRLEQAYAHVARDRESLLRMLAGPGALAALPPSIGVVAGQGQLPIGQVAAGASSLLGAKRGVGTPMMNVGARGGAAIDPALEAQLCITRLTTLAHNGPTSFLRSSRVPIIKPQVQPKVQAALDQMGISMRLTMPTRQNQDKLETLLNAIGNMVEMKRQVERLEYELQVRSARTVLDNGTAVLADPSVNMSEPMSRKRSGSVSSTQSGANKRRR